MHVTLIFLACKVETETEQSRGGVAVLVELQRREVKVTELERAPCPLCPGDVLADYSSSSSYSLTPAERHAVNTYYEKERRWDTDGKDYIGGHTHTHTHTHLKTIF